MARLITLAIEHHSRHGSLAWALDFPGCFARGRDDGEAMLRLPAALVKYAERIHARAAQPWLDLADFDLRLAEVVNLPAESRFPAAWFAPDARPLDLLEVERGLEMLRWSRADLLELLAILPVERRESPALGQLLGRLWEEDLRGLQALRLAPLDVLMDDDLLERLDEVGGWLASTLSATAGLGLERTAAGERWSPRKVLRRVLQNQLDAVGQVAYLALQS